MKEQQPNCPFAKPIYEDFYCEIKWRRPTHPGVNCIASRSRDCPKNFRLEDILEDEGVMKNEV